MPLNFWRSERIAPLLGLLTLALTLAGCGGGGESASADAGTGTGTSTVDEPIVVREMAPENVLALASGGRAVMTDLLVITDETVTRDAAASLFSRFGLSIVGRVPEANLYQVALPAVASEVDLVRKREQLAAEAGVLSVSLNLIPEIQSALPTGPITNYTEQEWAFTQMNANKGWDFLQSHLASLKPVKVGVIDSGFVTNVTGLNFAKTYGPTGSSVPQSAAPPPIKSSLASVGHSAFLQEFEEHHHGMHVAGIIAAPDVKDSLVVGLAWQAPTPTRMELHVAAKTDHISILAHIARLARDDVRVINVSLGYANGTDLVEKYNSDKTAAMLVSSLLKRKDFLLVFGAGNDHTDASKVAILAGLFATDGTCLGLPSAECLRVKSSVLIVGASGSQRLNTASSTNDLSYFSNHGLAVQLVAPGGDYSCAKPDNEAAPQTFYQNSPWYYLVPVNRNLDIACGNKGISSLGADGKRILMSGTSMAAPFVTGTAALMLSLNSNLTSSQLKELLIGKTALKSKRYFPEAKTFTGESYPALDVYASLVAAAGETEIIAPAVDTTKATFLISVSCKISAAPLQTSTEGVPGIQVKIQRRLDNPTRYLDFFTTSVVTDLNGIVVVDLPLGHYKIVIGSAISNIVDIGSTASNIRYTSDEITINPLNSGGSIRYHSIRVSGTSVSNCGQNETPEVESFAADDTPVATIDALFSQGGFGNLGGWNGGCPLGASGCSNYVDVELTLGANGVWRGEGLRSTDGAPFLLQSASGSQGLVPTEGGWISGAEGGTYAVQADGSVLVTGDQFGAAGATGVARIQDLAGQSMSVAGETGSTANSTFPAGSQGYFWTFQLSTDTYMLRTTEQVVFDDGHSVTRPASLAAMVDGLQTPAAGQALGNTWGWNGLEFTFDGALASQGAVSFWRRYDGVAMGKGQYELRTVRGQPVLVITAAPGTALADAATRDEFIVGEYGNRTRAIFGVVSGAVYQGTTTSAGPVKDVKPGLNMTALNAVLVARGLCTLPAPNGSGVCPPPPVVVTPPPVVTPPVAIPAVPTGTAPGTSFAPLLGPGVQFHWTGSTGATDYEVVFFDVAANSPSVTTRVSATSFLLGSIGLTSGRVYSWKVAACNAGGCSAYTPEKRFTRVD